MENPGFIRYLGFVKLFVLFCLDVWALCSLWKRRICEYTLSHDHMHSRLKKCVRHVQFPHCLRSMGNVVSRLAVPSTTEVSQGAAAEVLYSIPSPITIWWCTYYKWLYYTQGRVTKCLQGTLAGLRPLVSVSYQHLLLIFIFSPPPFASGCICRTKYRLLFHIHYYFPRRWGWALWCVRFRDLSRYVLSRLGDWRCGRWSRDSVCVV